MYYRVGCRDGGVARWHSGEDAGISVMYLTASRPIRVTYLDQAATASFQIPAISPLDCPPHAPICSVGAIRPKLQYPSSSVPPYPRPLSSLLSSLSLASSIVASPFPTSATMQRLFSLFELSSRDSAAFKSATTVADSAPFPLTGFPSAQSLLSGPELS